MTDLSEEPNFEEIAQNLHSKFEEQFGASVADKTASYLRELGTSSSQSYAADGNVASFVFYNLLNLKVNGGKSFEGKAWGVSTPGGGKLIGFLTTNDISALYARADSFLVNMAPTYSEIVFSESNGDAGGYWRGNAIATTVGSFGGTGSWS